MGGDEAKQNHWVRKFAHAFRGVRRGIHGQSSFLVHFTATVAVIIAAAAFRVSLVEWCLLALCIAAVLTAEMFNSALEHLARAVHDKHHPELGAALDISSAAVLLAALGAVVVGAVIFLNRLRMLLGY